MVLGPERSRVLVTCLGSCPGGATFPASRLKVGARGFAVSDEKRVGARVLGAGGRLPVWGWEKFYLHRTYEGLREAVDLVRIEV